jgi:hypothetical protein
MASGTRYNKARLGFVAHRTRMILRQIKKTPEPAGLVLVFRGQRRTISLS